MLQISEIVRKTEEMFDLFNKHFYEGELNRRDRFKFCVNSKN